MKEMAYKNKMGYAELLATGEYENYEYIVLSLGTHPCAYVILDENDKLFGKDYDDIYEEYDVDCHGGLTYSKDYLSFLKFSEKYKCDVKSAIHNKWVIGWDYAHYGDYAGFYGISEGKKWTTREIVDECKDVIRQLVKINRW